MRTYFLVLICSAIVADTAAQKIGMHVSNPQHPVHITQPSGTNLANVPVVHIEYTGTALNGVQPIGIRSKSSISGSGIGGFFEGGRIGANARAINDQYGSAFGVWAEAATGSQGTSYGFYGKASGGSTSYGASVEASGIGHNHGIRSTAQDGSFNRGGTFQGIGGNIAYGIYATASDATTNYAGYFAGGNVYITNKLGVATSPDHPVHINQPVGTTLSSTQPVMHVEYTGTNGADVIGFRSRCVPQDYFGVGGDFTGGWVGVRAKVSATGVQHYFATRAEADGTGGTKYAIYGTATGGGTNWAGYFENGNVYVKNRLGIGRTPSTNLLEVEGNASKSSAGDWVANSDIRLKKNITTLDPQETLEKLLALQGIAYEWNDDKTGTTRPEGVQYGFSAQNIQEVFPSLVESDALGYLQTAYGTYDAMMVEALRALQEQIDALVEENGELKAKVNTLAEKREAASR